MVREENGIYSSEYRGVGRDYIEKRIMTGKWQSEKVSADLDFDYLMTVRPYKRASEAVLPSPRTCPECGKVFQEWRKYCCLACTDKAAARRKAEYYQRKKEKNGHT